MRLVISRVVIQRYLVAETYSMSRNLVILSQAPHYSWRPVSPASDSVKFWSIVASGSLHVDLLAGLFRENLYFKANCLGIDMTRLQREFWCEWGSACFRHNVDITLRDLKGTFIGIMLLPQSLHIRWSTWIMGTLCSSCFREEYLSQEMVFSSSAFYAWNLPLFEAVRSATGSKFASLLTNDISQALFLLIELPETNPFNSMICLISPSPRHIRSTLKKFRVQLRTQPWYSFQLWITLILEHIAVVW